MQIMSDTAAKRIPFTRSEDPRTGDLRASCSLCGWAAISTSGQAALYRSMAKHRHDHKYGLVHKETTA